MTLRKNKKAAGPLAWIIISTLLCASASAQVHTPDLPYNKWGLLAEEQYQQGHYEMASISAKKFIAETHPALSIKNNPELDKAHYYLALSDIELNAPGCVDSAKGFIAQTANPAYRSRSAYALARHYFSQNKLADAIPYYEMAGIQNLSNRELLDEKFELAYCYFNDRQFDKAEPLFASIKETPEGKYYAAGNYYYGLLAYNENNYPDALQSFERIKDLQQYRSIVPYYIAEIYYFMGNRHKALEEAERLIRLKDKLYYDNELHLLAAQCLFEGQEYDYALPYFEYYYDHVDKIRKEDLYEMAYCYYRTEKWQNAIEKFKLLSNTRDSLAQTAMYLLGDCYLKTGDKQSARSAFGLCADMPYNHSQQEASMMLNAKLSYEMGYNDEAVAQLNNLLSSYPASSYSDEAKTLLSDLLIKTSNYTEALNQLEDVNYKTANYWLVYQKVTYDYAIQQFEKDDLNTADSFLTLSLQQPEDINYRAAAYFWKAEIAYQLNHFNQSVVFAGNFLDTKADPSAVQYLSPAATAQHAYIDMGYAEMEQNNYNTAQSYFSKAAAIRDNDTSSDIVATLREADAVFMQKDYTRALALYNNVIASDSSDADYARFQKSILLGLLGNTADKAVLLQELMNRTPPSSYAPNARYELATTYIEQNKYQAAIATLQPLTESYEGRNFAPRAWIKIGFAYQQLNNEDKAIEAYKHIVTEYPASEERATALDVLKSLYIENNQPAAYTQLLRDNNLPSADSSAIDSTYYAAAEVLFASGKWVEASRAMAQYLQQYPNGAFTIKAHYYYGESNYQLKNYKEALAGYDAVLQAPWNEFSENSAARAAQIAYNAKDYIAAATYYHQLRNNAMGKDNLQAAYAGLMTSSFNTNQYTDAIAYSDTLLSLPGLSDDMLYSASLYKAKSLQQSGKADDALYIYKQLQTNKNGAIAAESHYHIAEILFQQDKLKDAEAAADETVKLSGGYDYWIVSSYILLADISTKEKDYFNAKATLQSIVKLAKIPELKQEAEKKLEAVKALEKKQSKLSDE